VSFDSELYPLPAESFRRLDIAEGNVIEHFHARSTSFGEFAHRWWLYRPADSDPSTPLPATIFLDGASYVAADGPFRATSVLDNLIASGELPPMLGVFVEPGSDRNGQSNRSVEYETLSQRNVDFLIDELLAGLAGVATGPQHVRTVGWSSGGMAAVAAAWFRPDVVGGAYSSLGSFMRSPEGDGLPDLVEKSDRKPIRLFLQEGLRDSSHPMFGSGAERHADFVAALASKGYDFHYDLGDGTHDPAHGASLLPEALRWLWRPI
jgi:enterochelin esterase-like enzyme